ncbi:MAG: phosphate signaling complex protein PhoU [Armatimonadota bacterium]|nr:phosphate signaling complex protein PhoU [Armatimonadota bacterium]
MDQHTRASFDEQLRELQQELLRMGGVVEQMLFMCVKALVERDVALADETINMDDIVDGYNLDIETHCLRLLALQQPMARDLRTIAAVLKIITDVERMGDYAVDIAKTAKILAEKPLFKPLVDIPRMAEIVQRMLRESLQAFVNHDTALLEQIVTEDDAVDNYNRALTDELVGYMEKNPSVVYQAMRLILIVRYLERIADHITNVCERVYYMETGTLKELH